VPGHEAIGTVSALGAQTKGLQMGQRVGIGWSAQSCMTCGQCLAGYHNLCARVQPTIIGRHGAFADRVRCHWVWARPLPDGLEPAKAGPLFCGGITVFGPLLELGIRPTDRVGVIGIGGLGHLALQFANKWGCEVLAFTSSSSKEAEARQLGAHQVVNMKESRSLKHLTGSVDLLLVTANVSLDWNALLGVLAPKGHLHVVGAVPKPMEIPAATLIAGQKSVSSSPTGGPEAISKMLRFSARHGVAPVTEQFAMSDLNGAIDRLRSGQARYRVVLSN
jgi:alcohol/geraniol dehydrogenase (NADP+)